MKYVIIGNSAAAVGAVEAIRTRDQDGLITVVAKEPHHVYSRPLISYLLRGETDGERMKYRPDDFYIKNGVQALLGESACAIDPDKKEVALKSGGKLPYDKLLVAAGSQPFVPPVQGAAKVKRKFTFLSLDDARALQQALFPEARVLILGAGLIGLKCAEGIADKAASVTVVDLADRVLPSILDERGSEIMRRHIEAQNVDFRLSDSIASLTGGTALLKSGEVIPFDILVFAVGVRPNTDLVRAAGGAVNRGVVTDTRCCTTLPDVYAAGDCAESHDITTGTDRVLALWPNAYMQGECAGLNMAGGDRIFDRAMPMNAIGFFGLHIITAGSCEGESCVFEQDGSYKRLVIRDGKLVGYILIGAVERAGIYTALIRDRTPLNSIDFELIKEKPQLMAFSKMDRLRKLGGLD
ncbi:NAD(P)/FAD-dependent oxidoreductase [Anaerotruncus rubiinfantis]|uniref:NAD(P)/FAD-dependent oxidoreductase n=1 Tax=Anaerotruncus rubiinfantis TaxID=1720200 RepID=UPI00189B1889|nr:FAD-dependent oxidoreductase [Anaerotruncus rubiinfantis]